MTDDFARELNVDGETTFSSRDGKRTWRCGLEVVGASVGKIRKSRYTKAEWDIMRAAHRTHHEVGRGHVSPATLYTFTGSGPSIDWEGRPIPGEPTGDPNTIVSAQCSCLYVVEE